MENLIDILKIKFFETQSGYFSGVDNKVRLITLSKVLEKSKWTLSLKMYNWIGLNSENLYADPVILKFSKNELRKMWKKISNNKNPNECHVKEFYEKEFDNLDNLINSKLRNKNINHILDD